jgi:hypothetical protein
MMNTWTEEQKAKIEADYRRTRRSRCPEDGATLHRLPGGQYLGPATRAEFQCPSCGRQHNVPA